MLKPLGGNPFAGHSTLEVELRGLFLAAASLGERPVSDLPADVARLLESARQGSTDALGQALEACRAYLLVVAERELDPALKAKGGASDLVQETFLEAQRDFLRFAGDNERELLAWLRQVLLHNLASFSRRYRETKKRRLVQELGLPLRERSGAADPALCDGGPSPSVQAMEHEREAVLAAALASLPEDYRRILTLRYDEERSFDEIGVLMNRTANAARKLWARAIERLQENLEGRHGEY